MRIGLIVSASLIPRWALLLRERLEQSRRNGQRFEIVLDVHAAGDAAKVRDTSLDMLLRLERMLAGHQRRWLADNLAGTPEAARHPRCDDRHNVELLIDLSGDERRPDPLQATPRTLTPILDASPAERGLWPALLSGRAPMISLYDSATHDATPLAFPTIEAPHRLLDSAEAVLTHLVTALADAVMGVVAGQSPRPFATSPPPVPDPRIIAHAPSAIAHAAGRISRKAGEVMDRRLARAPAWQVAYRPARQRTHAPLALDAAAFVRLPDDGRRYYADPFVIARDGVTHLFVEELPYSSGRGIISHTVIEASGGSAAPVPVLEEAHHLSYPQVFEHAGHIWMLPEAAASGGLHLYRADPFPRGWVRHATLIDAPLHDATICQYRGMWWITAAVALGAASSWDTLALFSADTLEGPWRAHAGNPMLVDARAARPAGALYEHDGVLWRPAQDCRDGYGAALSLCRIDALDDRRFSQTLAGTLHFGAAADRAGPHTINYGGGYEVIDLYAPRPAADRSR